MVGVNLLREGLDLPEVSLVAILDADKEGFLRSEQSLVQTAGRAARNAEGRVILYADKITDSMQRLIDVTEYRRQKQMEYNAEHGIVPKTIIRSNEDVFQEALGRQKQIYKVDVTDVELVAEEASEYLDIKQIEKKIREIRKEMETASEAGLH